MLKKNSFSGGTDGGNITTSNSGGTSGDAFDSWSGSPTYTSSQATGSRAPLVGKLRDATVSSQDIQWMFTLAARTVWVRAYVYLSTAPSAQSAFIYDNDLTVNVNINTNRTISILGSGFPSGPTLVTSTTALPTGQWCRVEVKVVYGTTSFNGSVELRIYTSADSGTADDTKTASAVNTGTTPTASIHFQSISGLDLLVDDLGITDVDWLGPAATVTAVSGTDSGALTEQSRIDLATTDSGALTDASAPAPAAATTDSAGLSESTAIGLPTSDQATLGEQAGTSATAAVTDTGTLTDLAAPQPLLGRADAAALAEASALAPSVAVTDTASLAEAAPAIALATTDAAALAESAAIDETFGPVTSDLAALGEAAALASQLAAADTATLAETSAVVLLRTDVAAVTESSALVLLTGDAGALGEQVAIAAVLAASDQAVLDEVSGAGRPLAAADSAFLAELATVLNLGRDITHASTPYT
ncbi:hypothetical protein GCM10009530_63950 [Microbispora corallina]|uniref:Uncharacterized protein n=1 Tax=Microbispora corallina TaxID=83302 RepID=A0ABQ4GCE2_9ACTN|nr:hypothetical protein [Microbispora corallina]GIH44722.1 hypothetical protein Mco01_77220 [Microbispora corallina]